jgi:hypothetical protein
MLRLSVALYVLMFGASISHGFSLGTEIGSCFSGGCDVIWSINRNIDDGIRSKSESLVGPAKQAFLEAMQILFDEKLTPFLDRVDEVAETRLNQVQHIIDQTTEQVNSLINEAAMVARSVASDSINEIKKKIIDNTFDRADEIIKYIIGHLRIIINDVDCKIAGQREAVITWVQNLIKLPKPFNACYRKFGFVVTSPASNDYINIYRITKCEYEVDLEKSRLVSDVKFNYARLSLLARRFACIVGHPTARTPIEQDDQHFSNMFAIWDLASGRQ